MLSNGPLIAVCCQATILPLSSDTPVAIAPSELVRLRRRSDRGWRDDCLAGLAIDVVGRFSGWVDVEAGVIVLSEVASASMMMSGSGASTFAAECGRTATSRLTEVTTTTVPAGHRQSGGPDQELASKYQIGFGWPQSNDVPSTQMQWRITAIFRAMATFAFFMPIRLASFMPQAFREDHFLVR